jgi:hypothetical protein
MNPKIDEDLKATLMDYLHQLEDQISEIYHTLENDSSIPEDKFKVYEKRIENLFSIHNSLLDEVIFT